MSGCLACKACSTQCPIKIDVPEFRSRFLQLYHTRYLRPVRDHLVATVESYAPLMARAPKTFNFFINQPLVRKLSEKHIGMVDLPLLSVPATTTNGGHRSANMTLEQLVLSMQSRKRARCWWCRTPLPAITMPGRADFVRSVEKIVFPARKKYFRQNGKSPAYQRFS